MAIDLPPAPPALVQHAALVVTLSTGQPLEVSGATGLSEKKIQAAVASADSADEAAWQLRQAYVGAGLVLVHVQVESSGDASRLVVVHGRFSEFAGPERFRPYFADLLGRPGVIRSDVRTRSARADKKAEREGLGLRVHDVPTGTPGEYWLVVEAEDLARWHPVGASFAAGNYGTRYAGRDLGYANVRLNPGGGTQADMQFTKHIDNQSKNVEGADYTQGGLGTSVATPWGIYGLNGAVTDYQTGVDQRLTLPETTEGYIRQFGVWGEQLLYASRRVTWSVTESANHARNRVELPDDIRLFEQNYTLASLASTVRVEPSWEPEATLNVRLWVAQGLGGDFRSNPPPGHSH